LRNMLAIRTTRPAKPWPKVGDMSIIFAADRLDKQTGTTISSIWRHTFYPYKLYLPLPESDFGRLNTDMPNLIGVPVNPSCSQAQRMDAALDRCEGSYIAIVPSGFPVKDMWIENPLHALINSPADRQGFEPEDSTDELWAAVLKKDDLRLARTSFRNLPVRESLKAAGIALRHPAYEEFPFQLDNLLQQARSAQKDGNWSQAAQIYESIADRHQNVQWMDGLAARAFFEAAEHTRAAELCRKVNSQRPTVETLLLEAKLERQNNNFDSAIKLLKAAEQALADPLPPLLDSRACPGAGVWRHGQVGDGSA
jgi:hypothetical protein